MPRPQSSDSSVFFPQLQNFLSRPSPSSHNIYILFLLEGAIFFLMKQLDARRTIMDFI